MGCPKAKKLAAAVLPQWEAWQKMEHDRSYYADSIWRASRHFGWQYNAAEALEIWQKKQQRSKKLKTCNFCGETGHNKRTCSKLKETRKSLMLAELGYRTMCLEALQKTGQGIGAVVSGEREYWSPTQGKWVTEQSIGLVTGHRWEAIKFCESGRHGHLSINSSLGTSFIHVRWNNGDTDWITSLDQYSVDKHPILYRSWQNSKLSLVSRSEVLRPPASYLNLDLFCSGDILKGRKAQRAGDLHFIMTEKIAPFVEIGQNLSSTS